MASIERTIRGASGSPSSVVSLDDRRAAGAEARSQRSLNQLVHTAIASLEAVLAGDAEAVHDAFWAVSRALSIVLRGRLGAGWLSDRAGA